MTLVGVKAKNHRQQVRRRGADDATDDRRTPDDLWMRQHEGHRFTIDVAASAENAKLPLYFDIERDGLVQSWHGHRVWCNPPYSQMGLWIEKAWKEMHNGCELVVMLAPANRTEQGWWQENVEPYRDDRGAWNGVSIRVRFLAGRIRFQRPGWTKPTKGDRPPFGLCLLIWIRRDTIIHYAPGDSDG